MKAKLTVITDEHGKVIGSQLGHGGVRDPNSGICLWIVAGPGQRAHKIEYDVPELSSRQVVEDFHRGLEDHLKKSTGKPRS